jgi:hypothetical protein
MRLVLEVSSGDDVETIRKAFKDTTKACLTPEMSQEEQQDVVAIWTSYLDWEETQSEDFTRLDGIYKRLLRETLRQQVVPELHPVILAKYFECTIRHEPSNTLLATLERISTTYRPSYTFFREAFDTISAKSTNPLQDLTSVYRKWRAASQVSRDKVGATLHWAEWLLLNNHGKEAADAVDFMRREVGKDETALGELVAGWTGLLEDAENRQEESSDESDSEDEDEDEDEDVNMIQEGESSDEEDEGGSRDDVDMTV